MVINHAILDAYLDTLLEAHVNAGKDWLITALSQEGSGILHAGQPNRSSTEQEMPAVQQGHLRDSIDAVQIGRLAHAIGSFESADAEGYAEAMSLVSRPPSQGGRDFISMAAADPGFLQAISTGKP